MEILKNPNFDFFARTKVFVALSLALILGGIGYMATNGLRYGVEFSGGTQLIAKFTQAPQIDRIRAAVEPASPGATIQTYGQAASNQVLIRLVSAGQGELDALAKNVLQALGQSYSENPVLESSTEIVGPIVGAELRRKAVWLTVLGLVFQLIYIGFRFNGAIWGSAAAIACLHDVLVS